MPYRPCQIRRIESFSDTINRRLKNEFSVCNFIFFIPYSLKTNFKREDQPPTSSIDHESIEDIVFVGLRDLGFGRERGWKKKGFEYGYGFVSSSLDRNDKHANTKRKDPHVSLNIDDQNLEPTTDHTKQVAGYPTLEATNGKFTNGRTVLDKTLSLDSNKPSSASLGTNSEYVSFATLLKGESSRKQVNFHTFPTLVGNGADVIISKEFVSILNRRCFNSVYGFFLGKQVAFPVVENYVKNAWSKDGLVRSMMNINDANIIKEDLCNAPVLVKIHNIPITEFTEDGLSAIATKLGTPLMLDVC
ncbi:hypothetical protein Tco_0543727 [Tanacetum coccineum]